MYQIGESNRKNRFGSENRIESKLFCPNSNALLPGWAGTRKVKPIWILLKQETVSGSGISWTICKSAPRSRQTTTPAPHQCFFTGRMPFLPPNQQRQSTEGFHFLLTKSIFKVQKPRPAWKEQACSWMDWRYYVACSLTVLSVHQSLQTQTVHQVIIITTIISIIIITWSPIYKISYDLL